jgi:hypothetical protein
VNGKKITLQPNDFIAQSFIHYQEKRATPFGDMPADVFIPENKSHPLLQLTCDFLIIYMN